MSIIGIRASKNTNVKTSTLKELVTTSEANQWKIHKTGEIVATANNQTRTIEHGLAYTPAYIAFRRLSGDTYYSVDVNGQSYIDSGKLSFLLGSTGDRISYIIFKDFGA